MILYPKSTLLRYYTLMPENPPAIHIHQLTKTYPGGLQALKGIDLTVREGEFFALLGPNGAGKSTTISILCSLVNKTGGTVSICGHNIDTDWSKAKTCLGVVPQEFNFNIFEPCWQIVVNQAGYYGVPRDVALKRLDVLFDQLGLSDKRNEQAKNLSGGFKRRLMIARALIHEPRVLILDEPTAGVDISLRRSMWQFLQELNNGGMTIILTTHYLEEAEALCKEVAIIDHGKIVTHGNTQDLLQQLNAESFILYCTAPIDTLSVLPPISGVALRQLDPLCLEADIDQNYTLTELITYLQIHGITVGRIRNKANRLEELFLKLVNHD
jgi:ABC-2 type transport system ATP-binding protein